MADHGHSGWHTLHGEGRRLTTDDERLYAKYQVRIDPNGKYGNRFFEELDREQDCWMCVALSRERHIIGQTFGGTKKEARRAMEALFKRKGLGGTGLTLD